MKACSCYQPRAAVLLHRSLTVLSWRLGRNRRAICKRQPPEPVESQPAGAAKLWMPLRVCVCVRSLSNLNFVVRGDIWMFFLPLSYLNFVAVKTQDDLDEADYILAQILSLHGQED